MTLMFVGDLWVASVALPRQEETRLSSQYCSAAKESQTMLNSIAIFQVYGSLLTIAGTVEKLSLRMSGASAQLHLVVRD
jgi:hypothetical protein